MSGTASVLMKAWLDIRVDLRDDQVNSIFSVSTDTISGISGQKVVSVPLVVNNRIRFTSSLSKFSFDKLCITHAFEKVIQSNKEKTDKEILNNSR